VGRNLLDFALAEAWGATTLVDLAKAASRAPQIFVSQAEAHKGRPRQGNS
jgi:hypothetical protein